MSDYWILRGREIVPAELMEWAKFYETRERFMFNESVGDAKVSTVFLGLDHGYGDGAPVLFESMIFGGLHADSQWRYCTYGEAEAGHKRIVQCLRDGVDPNA